MRALTLLTNYVRNTLRTLAVALLLPVGIAAPVTIITTPAYRAGCAGRGHAEHRPEHPATPPDDRRRASAERTAFAAS